MNEIQLDMFEVQLGASILLQFRTESSICRVLADAGILAKGYSINHVHGKLRPAINSFSESKDKIRLDLIIGTHYDADHLDGLVPIINDLQIEIGEAWMPPVANDTEISPSDASIQDIHLLAYQFAQDDADKKLLAYLESKDQICQETRALQEKANNILIADYTRDAYSDDSGSNQVLLRDIDEYVEHFKRQISETASVIAPNDCSHADCEFDEEHHDLIEEISLRKYWTKYRRNLSITERKQLIIDSWTGDEQYIKSDLINLAYIRRGAAKDAINATSLYKVVKALNKRNIPVVCNIIPDGSPRRFIWDDTNKKFIPRKNLSSNGPELSLLGPSESLVKKHKDRLPIGEYILGFTERTIPVKNITPSNQLSYVLKFQHKGQGILITGDAGFVDFKPKASNDYYQSLLNQLNPLHIIQVAHHGGRNAIFYHALLKSDYPNQTDSSFLLLSHATHDKFRPSKEFGYFIENLISDTNDVKLLFTSEPHLEKVRDYKNIIHPPVTTRKSKVGDVQMAYRRQKWDVIKHSILV